MEGSIEKGPEKVLTLEGVLHAIDRFGEKTTLVRELHDEKGPYRIEVETAGKVPGETVHYEYMRKGTFPGIHSSAKTVLCAEYYTNGILTSAVTVADYHEESGEWTWV
jgi:hypothetical protein